MVPETIQSSYVDMLGNLDVFRMFPSIEPTAEASLSSTGSSEASSPASSVLSKRYDFLPSIPPRFVTFAWRYPIVHSLYSLLGGRVHH